MKRTLLSAMLVLPLSIFAQNQFTVKGKIGSLSAPAKAYLTYRVGTNNVTDSTTLKNGEFVFKGTIESPITASLRVKHDDVPVNPQKRVPADLLSFYLEGVNMNIVSVDSIKKATITGSKINDDNTKFKALLKEVDQKEASFMKEYNTYTNEQKKDEAFMKPFMEKYTANNKDKTALIKKFAEENRDSYIGLSAYRSVMGYDIDPKVVEPEFMKYSAAVRGTKLGKDIQGSIDGAKRSQLGVIAADFTQFDPDGKSVSLSNFKGKYVLVDFWASWCGPCRAENPNVLAAYNKYKNKNFEILGVSIDEPNKKNEWLKAVKDDGLTWVQVSDTKEGGNTAAKLYGVNAIPFNFIVDPQGKIVARNLRGAELEKKLAELLEGKAK